MKFLPTPISGIIVIEPEVYSDNRGTFFESYHREDFRAHGIPADFVQDNQSISGKGVIRGLHFQRFPHEQGKLVRVVSGSVYDVAVDIRSGSPTFGEYFGIELSASNRKLLWIPVGFAHGFASLESDTVFLYKVTQFYHKLSEGGIHYKDHDLKIKWNIRNPVVSEKDNRLPAFREFCDSLSRPADRK